MRKILLTFLALCMLVPTLDARRRVKRAGEIEDNVYKDRKYEFTVEIMDGWDANVEPNDEQNRLVLIQENPTIPPDYVTAPDYTMYPKLVLFVGESKKNAFVFLDSLLSDSYESDVKSEVLSEVEILRPEPNREDIITRRKNTITVDGERCVVWMGQVNYVQEVSTSASSLGGKRVYGSYGGAIWVIEHQDQIYVANLVCEYDYFNEIFREASQMVQSIDWPGNDEEEQETGDGDSEDEDNEEKN